MRHPLLRVRQANDPLGHLALRGLRPVQLRGDAVGQHDKARDEHRHGGRDVVGEFISTHPYPEFHLCYESFMDLAPRGDIENLFDICDIAVGILCRVEIGKFAMMPYQYQC